MDDLLTKLCDAARALVENAEPAVDMADDYVLVDLQVFNRLRDVVADIDKGGA